MSHLPDETLDLLNRVADEMRDDVSGRAYRVGVALEADPAFGSGNSVAWLRRDLVLDALSAAASRVGMHCGPVNGSGWELRHFGDEIERHFRALHAERRSDGMFKVVKDAESSLIPGNAPADHVELWSSEQWVFVWTYTAVGLIDETAVAAVVGYIEGRPGRLDLGPAILLGNGGGDLGGRLRFDGGPDEPLWGDEDGTAEETGS